MSSWWATAAFQYRTNAQWFSLSLFTELTNLHPYNRNKPISQIKITMSLSHIPKYTIQNRNITISVVNGILWDMRHRDVCEIGPFRYIIILILVRQHFYWIIPHLSHKPYRSFDMYMWIYFFTEMFLSIGDMVILWIPPQNKILLACRSFQHFITRGIDSLHQTNNWGGSPKNKISWCLNSCEMPNLSINNTLSSNQSPALQFLQKSSHF